MAGEIDRAGVAKAYERWAPIYDLVFGKVFDEGRKSTIAEADKIGGRILDVGVGTGLSLSDYSRSTRLCGVDISEPMLRKAQERVTDLGLTHVEGLWVMDAEHLTFPDDSFDVVVAQYVVTTVPNPEATLDEFARVLKPGGEIILVSRVGADVIDQDQLASWFEHADEIVQRGFGIRHRGDDILRHHRIEKRIRKRKILGVHHRQRFDIGKTQRAYALERPAQHRLGNIDAA